jgi:hypothetical protein
MVQEMTTTEQHCSGNNGHHFQAPGKQTASNQDKDQRKGKQNQYAPAAVAAKSPTNAQTGQRN